MPIFQAFNKKNKAWVKYKMYKGKAQLLNVKEREPTKPFAGVPKRGKGR